MVAGATLIDAFILVVAADDGWMPQSEEHLQVCICSERAREFWSSQKRIWFPRKGVQKSKKMLSRE